jgi:diaminopimelate decarboxylase
MRVYVSGLSSGPNPSPGIGVARSLRAGYPDAELVGVDYSTGSTGLHWPEFDSLEVRPGWRELNLADHANWVRELLESGSLWISGLDLEAWWLSTTVAASPGLLSPSADTFRSVRKPPYQIASTLRVAVPPTIAFNRGDWDLYGFCSASGWNVWVKGPYYQATRVRSWPALVSARDDLSATWSTSELHLQAHVQGLEESIAFAAYQGQFLGACHMVKRAVTSEGKTWAGEVRKVGSDRTRSLIQLVGATSWHGGGELEFVRDETGKAFLIEVNPRFPAWIYGASLTGCNLPAALVERASGESSRRTARSDSGFVRVVIELPARNGVPLPEPPSPGGLSDEVTVLEGKHPSGMPVLARRLHAKRTHEFRGSEWAPSQTLLADLQRAELLTTPTRILLERTAKAIWSEAAVAARGVALNDLSVTVAYSIKTNPDSRLLRLSRARGFYAETISQLEVDTALSAGFLGTEIVLNGPGKGWPEWPRRDFPLGAIFADSVDELQWLVLQLDEGKNLSSVVGLRVRPRSVQSRFGADLEREDVRRRLRDTLVRFPDSVGWGLHFHVASNLIGERQWQQCFQLVLQEAADLQVETGRPIECLDVGGGWNPSDWSRVCGSMRDTAKSIRSRLPSVSRFILEPGRAIAQPSMALVCRILETRHDEEREVVVDASIAELPEARNFPHRPLWRDSEGAWRPFRCGTDRILGRLCMENDVLADGVSLPDALKPGDLIAFWDAGAYDASMAFRFGQG